MAIPQWLRKAAEEAGHKDAPVDFSDGTYAKLIEMYKSGKLDNWASGVIEEVEQLRDVMNSAVSQVSSKLGLTKIALKDGGPMAKDAPFEIGDERLKEVPTAPKPKAGEEPSRRLPPKMKEPETTKWKEIRFNKRTGTWQVVVTIRHTRNFMSENEAVDFTKKASLEVETKYSNPASFKGEGYYVVEGNNIVSGPINDAVAATKTMSDMAAKNPGKAYDVAVITSKSL